ncbi:hypothetical protein RFI_15725 [Reticulomyxa filosa]|uniref:LysM domain-containing protein n=1 Tax=Reticulomyxa filosa TaxID=46433 RepID=X6N640_RETFI|nr:hypothetical protein RFI_15725 [Reticulomyxa filosa]|eukprot:ETO21481.1 hypothetical protein RFI_15725 [Reticulomyxa filosa]
MIIFFSLPCQVPIATPTNPNQIFETIIETLSGHILIVLPFFAKKCDSTLSTTCPELKKNMHAQKNQIMYHIPLPVKPKELDYSNLKMPQEKSETEEKVPHWPNTDGSIPQAPKGFAFHRVRTIESEEKTKQMIFFFGLTPSQSAFPLFILFIQEGDSLVSLSLRFGVSQAHLRKLNKEACFGHQLGHMVGKLLLIPLEGKASLSTEDTESVEKAKEIDEQLKRAKLTSSRPEDEKQKEPDEDGKYNLRKAFQFYAPEVDDHRCNYYLG